MKAYFGYIRVSTAKQGTHGVSLVEQKSAIERYAAKSEFQIIDWFEERETAAKRGRPVFSRMLALMRKGKAAGVIMHKIDRSARNLKDWADLGELIDAGVEVHFAADALDLNSRGGRLSADIQAVVAADYIRNLREETRKGFYGRLKQGLYPLGAPVGYLNQGGGKAKTPDPATAPFIRRAFELYATGRYSLHMLRDELVRTGFRRPTGSPLRIQHLSLILNNPFYAGIIRLRRSRETFRGVHEPLISIATFERVRAVLKGKLVNRMVQHDFLYRRLFTCASCDTRLIGERQKGYVYYRCHTRGCTTTGAREEQFDSLIRELFARVQLTAEEVALAKEYLKHRNQQADKHDDTTALAISNAKARLDRLTDAFVDGLIVKSVFEERRATLTTDIAKLEDQLAHAGEYAARQEASITRTLELAENLVTGYEIASLAKKREILELTTSNRMLAGKKPAIRLQNPFDHLANRASFSSGDPVRNTRRTTEMGCKLLYQCIDRILDQYGTSDEQMIKSVAII